MTVEVVDPDDISADESTPGVVRKTVFRTDNAVLVQSRITGGTISGWHHHGDRHTYGYIVKGAGALEHGPGGDAVHEGSAGEYFQISPRTIHRDVNSTDEELVVLVCFVGSGPVVVNVDEPDGD